LIQKLEDQRGKPRGHVLADGYMERLEGKEERAHYYALVE
jgi:hypothetical protein